MAWQATGMYARSAALASLHGDALIKAEAIAATSSRVTSPIHVWVFEAWTCSYLQSAFPPPAGTDTVVVSLAIPNEANTTLVGWLSGRPRARVSSAISTALEWSAQPGSVPKTHTIEVSNAAILIMMFSLAAKPFGLVTRFTASKFSVRSNVTPR